MKKLFFLYLLSIPVLLTAQRISTADYKALQQFENNLKPTAVKIIQGINAKDRFEADSLFTRQFVTALKTKNSFFFAFDSLETISRLYAPDSSFKIFTWQMVINDNVIRQHGAIQMRTTDGSLKLFPLIDKSDVTKTILDTIGNNKGWIGAIYYRIIQKKSGGENYYTLIGYDENNIRTNRKIIEVLYFEDDVPMFGKRIFSFENDKPFKSTQSRYIMEYKKNASPRLNYDEELDMIIVEHLVSESGKPNSTWTLVGDGDYEGFTWKNGKWIHIDKVFNQATPENKPPVPVPLKESKLGEN
ncbi:MAG: hypothetical protein KA319_04625 [Ferruginibacter sp.]|nr:hypothetical protein [Ferruginibacter sp.]